MTHVVTYVKCLNGEALYVNSVLAVCSFGEMAMATLCTICEGATIKLIHHSIPDYVGPDGWPDDLDELLQQPS